MLVDSSWDYMSACVSAVNWNLYDI